VESCIRKKSYEMCRGKFYTFCMVYYGELLKKRPTNAPVVYLFSLIYSRLHVPVVI
jgi:hypothetical protein